MKKSIVILSAVTLAVNYTAVLGYNIPEEYEWATEAVEYCLENDIMNGVGGGELALGEHLTREQMAKLLVEGFDKTIDDIDTKTFKDIDKDRWSYKYIEAFAQYMKEKDKNFTPKEYVTREEFAASLVMISGLKESHMLNKNILEENFNDASEVSDTYKKLLCIAVEKGYMKGDGENINPKALLTRAETCTFIYRVLESKAGNIKLDLGVKKLGLTIKGEPTVTLEQAKAWASKRGAHQRFIDIADVYWKYGEITGIRPEILYAQAAKETAFGKYGGNVLPEQNNWAGIKTRTGTGDTTADHETFETPDDGVRAHFNHIAAYIGTEPVGEPHGRYYSVKTLTWAGTVVYLEELGGKWCPDLYYGYSIYYNYLKPMHEF